MGFEGLGLHGTLYESEDRLGGHTNTVPFMKGHSTTFVDAGFIAFNNETYRKLTINCVNEIAAAEREFEWAGTTIRGLFAQFSNICRLDFWRMLFDILRFNLSALDLVMCREQDSSKGGLYEGESLLCDASDGTSDRYESIGSYMRRYGYSRAFIHSYLIPILAATWCTRPDIFQMECPAYEVVRFM
nr:hypothetical protein CFP56_46782 [Quercus suber]